MSDLKTTPTRGPWSVGDAKNGLIDIVHANNEPGAISHVLARVVNRKSWSFEAEANAHLIAAGPCMFEALRRARLAVANAIEIIGSQPQDPEHETLRMIDAALSKARGRRS